MKTSITDFLIRKISAGINWRYASRHFGKAFWILTLACVSCTANLSAPSMLPVTGAETKLAFLPELVDFGIQPLEALRAAQTVTIRNDDLDPLKMNDVSVLTGFFVSENFKKLGGIPSSKRQLQGIGAFENGWHGIQYPLNIKDSVHSIDHSTQRRSTYEEFIPFCRF